MGDGPGDGRDGHRPNGSSALRHEVIRRQAFREALREEGFRLGFDAIGFAPPRLPLAGARFRKWLAAGHQGEMAWLHRNPTRRSGEDPETTPDRTVVACALNYYAGEPARAPEGGGVVSQYARGEDYHRVLDRKLRALARWSERAAAEAELLPKRPPGARRRIPVLVDHGPLLEKAYAEQAGLGWTGKHSNLIATRGSSWFFLGELILPFALPPDDAHPDRCGTCTRCIAACPTDAIVAPYVVDSRRCISYLTIELRGPIPEEFREAIGDRIFGCDDCQDVCPWNRFARQAEEPALAASADGLHTETLVRLLALTREEFRSRTRRSAVRRAGYAGFLRNVAVALGNTGDPGAFPALAAALDHEEPLVRGHAAWALARVDRDRSRGPLLERLADESDAEVRREIEAALALERRTERVRSRPVSQR